MSRFFGIIAGLTAGTIIVLGAIGIIQYSPESYVGIPEESLIGPRLL